MGFLIDNAQEILIVVSGVIAGASIALNALARFFPSAGKLAAILGKLSLNVPQIKK